MAYFSSEKVQSVIVIRFAFNEINLQQREELKKELGEMYVPGETRFVFNLAKIGFLSSLVIATMVFFAKKVREAGGDIKLCGLSEEAQYVIKVTQLDKMFAAFATEEEAIKSFGDKG